MGGPACYTCGGAGAPCPRCNATATQRVTESRRACRRGSSPDVWMLEGILLAIFGPGFIAAVALEHADDEAPPGVHHLVDQLGLSVAPAPALFPRRRSENFSLLK